MNGKSSVRRLVENEAVFRRHNEKVQRSLEALDKLGSTEGHIQYDTDELTLQFYCECSDENCTLRLPLKLAEYSHIHLNRRNFIITPGHEVESIEKIVKKMPDYFVVEKTVKVPEQSVKLRKTKVKNV